MSCDAIYANDTMFVFRANRQNILVIKSILRYFELALGLKVNLPKSKI